MKVSSHFQMPYALTNLSVDFAELPDVPVNYPATIELTTPHPFKINVQSDQPLQVMFNWEQIGAWAALNLGALVEFYLEVLFEKMGPGPDLSFGRTVPYTIGISHVYNEPVNITPYAIATGVYKVIVLFKAGIPGGFPDDKHIAAFDEIGILNVYKAD